MTIIAGLPYDIQNGDPVDATPVMANFDQILSNVNANAADLNAQNTFSQPQNGVDAILPAQFATLRQVQSQVGSAVPVGTVIDFAGPGYPSNYLLCDGSAVNRTTYSGLFAAIGTIWGNGDGVTTFNLPDFRRAGSVGSGGAAQSWLGATVGNAGGAEQHAITTAEMPTHSHGINDPTHSHGINDPTHAHAIVDSGHAHAVNDPGHAHSYTAPGATLANSGTFFSGLAPAGATTGGSGTGISIFANGTGISIVLNGTGISINGAATGISVQNAGSGNGMTMYSPVRVLNKIIRAS